MVWNTAILGNFPKLWQVWPKKDLNQHKISDSTVSNKSMEKFDFHLYRSTTRSTPWKRGKAQRRGKGVHFLCSRQNYCSIVGWTSVPIFRALLKSIFLLRTKPIDQKCFFLKISRFLCFSEIHRFQILWRHHRNRYIMEVTLMLISFES